MSTPCPKCGRMYCWDGSRCCNKFCRYGSTKKPEVDFTEIRKQTFLSNGGRPATAVWVPAWYELDPPCLEVGLTTEFWFFRFASDYLDRGAPLQLYCGIGGENVDVAWGTISAIQHPELGSIHSVKTRGLDYKVTLDDGTELSVNAEENPGEIYDPRGQMAVKNWQFAVEFGALAEREPSTPRQN